MVNFSFYKILKMAVSEKKRRRTLLSHDMLRIELEVKRLSKVSVVTDLVGK